MSPCCPVEYCCRDGQMEPKQSVCPDIYIVMHETSSYWVQSELPVPCLLFFPNGLCLLLAILDLRGELSISQLQQFFKCTGSGGRKMISGSLKLNFPGIKRFGSPPPLSFFLFCFKANFNKDRNWMAKHQDEILLLHS